MAVDNVPRSESCPFFANNFVVHRLLPQGSIQLFPTLRLKTELHKESCLALACRVSRRKQIFDDLRFTNFRSFDSTKFHSKAVISVSANLATFHAAPRQYLSAKSPLPNRPTTLSS